jgi:lipoyl(octanoyl) transferase
LTFHGPGQLVIYPILNLYRFKPNLHWYVDNLAQVLIESCKEVGLQNVSCKDSIGVYVDDNRKIGFIGARS